MISPKKTPVGLEPGDKFETPFGYVKILNKDENQYQILDPETGEKVWLPHSTLIDVMQANIYDY